jgi:protein involved in polysaccharide export with SLBB domain
MKRIFLLGLFYCLSTEILQAQALPQQQQQQQQTPSSLFQSPTSQGSQASALSSTSIFTSSSEFYRNLQGQGMMTPPPYDTPVDTNGYVLGPGDIVNVGIWGPTPISLNLSINPEGTLIIPTYGELKAGGMTIAAAKAYARKKLGEQFKKSNITLTLIYPRTFYVVVAGKVKTPARFIATAFDRVDRVFTLSNLPVNSSDTTPPPHFSLRNIKLVHSDGSRQNVDLLKFYQTGDYSNDPLLRQGDAVIVPEENFLMGNVSISGAVKMPGTYEYVPGDRVKDLLEISQGLTTLADSSRVEVYSWNGSGYIEKTINLDDSAALELPLSVSSRIVVPTDRNRIHDYYVSISGEVGSPGIYPILQDSTKLSDVIKMAGGFTKWASLPGAAILRLRQPDAFVPPPRNDPNSYVQRASGLTQEDLSYAAQELSMRTSREIVSTSFVKLFADKDENYDCTLRSGDSIYIPRSRFAVYVMGQVRYPGYVDYRDDWSCSDYINAAGGFADGAEKGTIKLLKHGTYQWYDPGESHIEPGDVVFVPKVSIKPELYSWNMFKDVIGLVGSVASIAATAILVIRATQGK